MELVAFRDIARNLKAPLAELFSSALTRRYTVFAHNQIPEGQQWLLSCDLFASPPGAKELPAALELALSRRLRFPLFRLQTPTASDRLRNDVTGLFQENEALLEDLICADEHGRLASIQSVLEPMFVRVRAGFYVKKRRADLLLEEDICLIEAECVSCMQNERWWARVPAPSGFTSLRLPFDKLDLISGAVRVRCPHRLNDPCARRLMHSCSPSVRRKELAK